MYLGAACLVTLLSSACAASNWRWPEEARAASVRIDTKVRFVDDDSRGPNKVQADEIKPPLDTEGFYNRPSGAGSGRYPVQNEQSQRLTHSLDSARPQFSDGTLDSLQYCKCVASPTSSCHSPNNLPRACSAGMNLCCYKRSNRAPHGSQSEIFSELDDERPILLPNYERRPGLFHADHEDQHNFMNSFQPTGFGNRETSQSRKPVLVGPDGPSGNIGPNRPNNRVLVGPSGPTGVLGPNQRNPNVLVGPDGPTGVIGPNHRDNRLLVGPGVLAGPGGPTGIIGPNDRDVSVLQQGSNKRNPGVLVGPSGPTGVIGPNHRDDRDFTGPSGFVRPNQHNPGILVGPEGPTGHIGVPNRHNYLVGPDGPTGEIGPDHYKDVHSANHGAESAQVLVGPGGPTGIIGPGVRRGRWQTGPGILSGPGGPTGIIGPGQRLLVGPGGPTGRIGPRGYGQYGF